MSNHKEELRQKIDLWFEKHTDDMIKDLGKFVEINSVKTDAEEGAPCGAASKEVLVIAEEMLKVNGFDVKYFEDIMIESDLGPTPPLLGILAHLDIVDAGDGWDTDPFKLTIKDGILYGRGVVDNKGPAVASMYALYCARELCPELKHGVRLILGAAEESGCEDIASYLKKNTAPPNVFSPDANFPVVNTEKGRFAPFFGAKWSENNSLPRLVSLTGGKTINIVPHKAEAVVEGFAKSDVEAFCREYSEKTNTEISVTSDDDKLIISADGKATHASTPELGNNAQTALIEMLAAMPFAKSEAFNYIQALNKLFRHGDYHGRALGIEMSDEISGKLTVNFGVIEFSELEFSGNFDSRTPSCADEVDITGIVTAALTKEGIKITESSISKCHHTSEDTPFVKTLLQTYVDYTGRSPECEIMGGQTYVHGIPGGVAFGVAFPGENNNVHGANEYISLDQLILSAKMFTQVIIDMCG